MWIHGEAEPHRVGSHRTHPRAHRASRARRPDSFVDDVAPFEQRKLWLLNGAHSVLAYSGLLRGHTTVAQAIRDDTCRRWAEQWWAEASAQLDQPEQGLRHYRDQLIHRFANPRIRHLPAQIAMDGSLKLRVRASGVAAGVGRRPGTAASRMIASWMAYIRSAPAELNDPLADKLRQSARVPQRQASRELLRVLDAERADNDGGHRRPQRHRRVMP